MNTKTMLARFVAYALLFAFGFPLVNHLFDTGVHFTGGLLAGAAASAAYLLFALGTAVLLALSAKVTGREDIFRNPKVTSTTLFISSALFLIVAGWLAPAFIAVSALGTILGALALFGIMVGTYNLFEKGSAS